MAIVGLYAGIGGFELGFQAAGFEPLLLADRNPYCQEVLRHRFPSAPVAGDVADLESLPQGTRIVTAGFPCQNLSMAGDKAGLNGSKSGDIRHLFDLLAQGDRPTVAIENVYFMLHLDRGAAMAHLVGQLERLEYQWAYRVVNTLAFGLPQRRRRVFLVASRELDPRKVLFADESTHSQTETPSIDQPLGFYWTEGRAGVGLAVDAIPPLKVASGWGIPSTPAVLFPDGRVLLPSIEACEMLQGFPAGWTNLPFQGARSPRWSMVGNAVSVPAANWLAKRLKSPGYVLDLRTVQLASDDRWPSAAFGGDGQRWAVEASDFPVRMPTISISEYWDENWKELSLRALRGFIGRAEAGGLRFPQGFLDTLRAVEERKASE